MNLVSLLWRYRDVDAVLLLPMKDFRLEDKEEVLLVRVDVGRPVKEHVRVRVVERICLSVDRTDTVSPSWWTMSCLFPSNENPETPNSRASC